MELKMNLSMQLSNHTNETSSCTQSLPIFKGFDEMMIFFYIIVITISTIGNLLLIFVVSRNVSMQTFTNFMICNCACSDLLNSLIPGVINVVDTLISNTHGWMFGSFVCSFLYLCNYWSVSVTIITLTIIAVDRYFVIVYSKNKLTTSILRYIIPVIWIVGFGFASPSTFMMQLKKDGEFDVCVEWWPHPFNPKQSPKHYTVVLFVFLYVIPLFIMTKIYIDIANKMTDVKRNMGIKESDQQQLIDRKKSVEGFLVHSTNTKNSTKSKETHSLLHTKKPQQVSASTGSKKVKIGYNSKQRKTTVTVNDNTKGQDVWLKERPRVIKMMVTIVICFAICWFPVFLIQFLIYFDPYFVTCPSGMPEWAFVVGFFFQYCSSAITPLIYFGFSFTYRKGFKKSVTEGIKRQR